jgi:hypothetical protein
VHLTTRDRDEALSTAFLMCRYKAIDICSKPRDGVNGNENGADRS